MESSHSSGHHESGFPQIQDRARNKMSPSLADHGCAGSRNHEGRIE